MTERVFQGMKVKKKFTPERQGALTDNGNPWRILFFLVSRGSQ